MTNIFVLLPVSLLALLGTITDQVTPRTNHATSFSAAFGATWFLSFGLGSIIADLGLGFSTSVLVHLSKVQATSGTVFSLVVLAMDNHMARFELGLDGVVVARHD